jgi:DNA-binding transcriptional LysR family regulator
MDRLDAMRAFAAVADLGGFAPAARRLRLSPAAVTRAVALLEDHLGLTLLNRTTRSVRLTERGAIYLEACRRVLADLEQGERLARGQDSAPQGRLTVSAPILFGRLHVLPIVQDLLRAHPALSLRLILLDRIVHLVEEDIDVAVRIGELADSAMAAVKVAEVRRVLVASPDYLARRGTPRTPADLAGHDLIAFEGLDATGEWRFGADGKTAVRVAPRLSVNSADASLVACEAGLGITRCLSYQVQGAMAAGRLTLLLELFAPAPIPVSLVHPARRLGSANLTAFMDAARAHFRARPVGGGVSAIR